MADHAIGRPRAGLGPKIPVVVDARGLPLRFPLSPGQGSDAAPVPGLRADLRPARATVADRGCDARPVRDPIAHGSKAHAITRATQRDRKGTPRLAVGRPVAGS